MEERGLKHLALAPPYLVGQVRRREGKGSIPPPSSPLPLSMGGSGKGEALNDPALGCSLLPPSSFLTLPGRIQVRRREGNGSISPPSFSLPLSMGG